MLNWKTDSNGNVYTYASPFYYILIHVTDGVPRSYVLKVPFTRRKRGSAGLNKWKEIASGFIEGMSLKDAQIQAEKIYLAYIGAEYTGTGDSDAGQGDPITESQKIHFLDLNGVSLAGSSDSSSGDISAFGFDFVDDDNFRFVAIPSNLLSFEINLKPVSYHSTVDEIVSFYALPSNTGTKQVIEKKVNTANQAENLTITSAMCTENLKTPGTRLQEMVQYLMTQKTMNIKDLPALNISGSNTYVILCWSQSTYTATITVSPFSEDTEVSYRQLINKASFDTAFASVKTYVDTQANAAQGSVDQKIADAIAKIKNAFKGAVVTLSSTGWNDNGEQTVNCAGVDADISDVTVSPAVESMQAYLTAGIYLKAIADGSLTFFCSDTPSTDITVNVEINNVRGLS